MNELITIRQLPIISERLKEIRTEVIKKRDTALAMPVTPESIKEVKKSRAELSKEYKEYEGLKCPYCNVTGKVDTLGPISNNENGTATQPTICNNCEGEWDEIWELKGWKNG